MGKVKSLLSNTKQEELFVNLIGLSVILAIAMVEHIPQWLTNTCIICDSLLGEILFEL